MFGMHKCNDSGLKAIDRAKTSLSKVCQEILAEIPDGRDKSIFITKVEEAAFFMTRAIASKQGNFTDVKEY
jgi:hypothetical protein